MVTDELLGERNTYLSKATSIIMVPTRIRFLTAPLLSAFVGRESDLAPGRWGLGRGPMQPVGSL